MATYWTVRSLPRAPDRDRRSSLVVQISNYALGMPPDREEEIERASPENRFHLRVAQIVHGMVRSDVPTPWTIHPPARVRRLCAALDDGWQAMVASGPGDDMRDWWETQYLTLERVLSHASERGEWIASVHESIAGCFERGGTPELPSDKFVPICRPSARSLDPYHGLLGGAVLGVLALVGFRMRRVRAIGDAGASPSRQVPPGAQT